MDTNNYILEEESNEKRKSHREPVNIFADYSISGQFKNDLIKNLSEGGVFIETNEILEVGEYIVLTYNNPNNNENVKIGGVVARKEQRGVGVKFNIRSKIDKEKTQKRKEQVEDVSCRKVKRSKGVTFWGWFFIIISFIGLWGEIKYESYGTVISIFNILSCVAYLLCGVFILKLNETSRKAVIILSVISILSSPFYFNVYFNEFSSSIDSDDVFKMKEEKIANIIKPEYQEELLKAIRQEQELLKKTLSIMAIIFYGSILILELIPIYFFTRPKVRKQFNSTNKKTTQSVVILLFLLVLMLWGLHDLWVKMQILNNGQEITGKIVDYKIRENWSYSNSQYDLRHGNLQVSKMISDLPRLSQIKSRYGWTSNVQKADEIWVWAAKAYGQKVNGELIEWDNSEVTAPIYVPAEHSIPYNGEKGLIRIRKVFKDKNGQVRQATFDELWSFCVFELINIQNADKFNNNYHKALAGKLTKEEWVEVNTRLEYNALVKRKEFYKTVWIPWSKIKGHQYEQFTWEGNTPDSYEEWINLYKPLKDDPYIQHWEDGFDKTIVPYLKKTVSSKVLERNAHGTAA